MIQHEFITLTLTNEWDLASLEYSQETEGPYSTYLPTPDDIRRILELECVMVDRTIKSQTVTHTPNQILTKELSPDMKQWEELIRENVRIEKTKRSKNDQKNQQETTRNERDKKKSEGTVKEQAGSARHSNKGSQESNIKSKGH
ncbi:hypothetical protein Tco_1469627 [Tanacetum coccineum]